MGHKLIEIITRVKRVLWMVIVWIDFRMIKAATQRSNSGIKWLRKCII